MSTATPVHPRVMRAVREIQENGIASRPWLLTGRLLSLCQHCERFTGEGCEIQPAFVELLTDSARWCGDWKRLHRGD